MHSERRHFVLLNGAARWRNPSFLSTIAGVAVFTKNHLVAILFQLGDDSRHATDQPIHLAVQTNQCSLRYTWQPFGRRSCVQWSSRTLGSPCMNAFSPSAKVPSEVVDTTIWSVMLMDDNSGGGHLRSISWMSGSLRPCTHHLVLGL